MTIAIKLLVINHEHHSKLIKDFESLKIKTPGMKKRIKHHKEICEELENAVEVLRSKELLTRKIYKDLQQLKAKQNDN